MSTPSQLQLLNVNVRRIVRHFRPTSFSRGGLSGLAASLLFFICFTNHKRT